MTDRLVGWIMATQRRATVTATLILAIPFVAETAGRDWVAVPFGVAAIWFGVRACWSSGYTRGVADARDVVEEAREIVEEQVALAREALDAVAGLEALHRMKGTQ